MAEIATTILLLIVVLVGVFLIQRLSKYKNLPPGPWGIPILGYLPFIDEKQPHITFTKLANKFGPIYSLQMGNVFTVILSDPKLIREAFTKDVFAGRAPLYMTHGIMEGYGLICSEGPLWKDQRKLVQSWLRDFGMTKHSANRQNLEKRIIKGVDNLLEELDTHDGYASDFQNILEHTLGNVVGDMVYGFTYKRDEPTWQWIRSIQRASVEKMGVAAIINFLPFLRFISKSSRHILKTLLASHHQTHAMVLQLANLRRSDLGLSEKRPISDFTMNCIEYNYDSKKYGSFIFNPENLMKSDGDSILDRYVIEQQRRQDENDESQKYVTDPQMLHFLGDLFGAGLDTTAGTMAWLFLMLAIHEDIQEKVRAEIVSVCKGSAPTLENWDELKLVHATISEIERYRVVVPAGVPHGVIEDTKLAGYNIPKGSMVMSLLWAVHMNPKQWDDPEVFRPSRFLDLEDNILKPQYFIPFQIGKRVCPGEEFSRLVLFLHLTRVLWSRKLRLPDDVIDPDISGVSGLTLSPPPIPIIFEPIDHLDQKYP